MSPQRLLPGAAILAAAALLAACGSSAAPIASESESGAPAAWWGTKGVEATVRNADANGAAIRLCNRRTNDCRDLAVGQSTTFQGESTITDDLELRFVHPRDGGNIEMDFSNPSVGCPNLNLTFDMQGGGSYCDVGREEMRIINNGNKNGVIFLVKREGDSRDNKRFTVTIQTIRCYPRFDCS